MATREFLFAGFGGQGLLFSGKVLAYKGLIEDKNVSWLPSYGPEMRGGTANCTVIISDKRISCPLINDADVLVAMNLPSLRKFESMVNPGGVIFINSSIVPETSTRTDVKVVEVPANDKAAEVGNSRAANIVMLGAILAETGCCKKETVVHQIEKIFSGRKEKFLAGNIAALELYCK